MIMCSKPGCRHAAEVAPKVSVPAEGLALEAHQPMSFVVGLPVCGDHFAEMHVLDFLSADLKERLTASVCGMGRVKPDFARAWLTGISIASNEYLMVAPTKERA